MRSQPHRPGEVPEAEPRETSRRPERRDTPRLERLTCEGLTDPPAIGVAAPRLGWQLRSGPAGRRAAQLPHRGRLGQPAARRREGRPLGFGRGALPALGGGSLRGRPLGARTQCWWRVTVRTEKGGRRVVSPIARFGVGLTDPAAVAGRFIGLEGSGATAVLLRRRFDLPETGDAALLHVNSLGYHEVWINGRRAGDACLAPALSQLDKRSLWVTYDAAPYLREGVNEVVIWLGQGWYKRGTFGRWQPDEPYTEPLVRAQIDTRTDGTWQTVCRTDLSWRAALSGYRDTGVVERPRLRRRGGRCAAQPRARWLRTIWPRSTGGR